MSAKSLAVKFLSRREHSACEIRDKLRQRDFEDDEIERVITELEQGGWLSDERFAEAYIRMRQMKGFGPLKIAQELCERGVDEGIFRDYMRDDTNWRDLLEQQYHKKFKDRVIEDYNDKAKRIRFLQYRGFALDQIYRVVK